jgi:16S rRNA (guanine527-N7)-methyltransferase
MNQKIIEDILSKSFGFDKSSLEKLRIYHDKILEFNKKYNIISKNTENDIWQRHILDSAQVIKYIEFKNDKSLADMGSGAGFPGMVLAIYNNNPRFHVKLYEKSKVKCQFLNEIKNLLNVNVNIYPESYINHKIDSYYVVSRAFKKLDEIMEISREIIKVNHRLIVLKGENAQKEINNLSESIKYRYELLESITNKDSKILIVEVEKKN